ncbi:protein phosphatase 1 regulatory subunit 12A isoform X16 [Drosophila innubila]|uniref:protein phosphatase 1 regulatory subunit 12A isoform X16 n=1 Tax=Drosophila innubila TaxID=198719 RepID=UPI00148D0C37|nr:protein phosphatase 1 regulatory subunit 12A isoform X16 [Drosophila innubila]
MSTLDVPNNSAMMKRAEQLKRWEESDTNRAAPTPRRTHNGRHIKFSSGCVFLAACLSGDKDDVLQLIDDGADINTANVDGLTALHQACIDDKLEMVEFLVTHGADINRQDNEGWTPLHATASCGFVSIAQYLVENHADVAAVNSDGDLALDLAIDVQHMPMIDYMEKVVQELNIDVDQARKAEEKAMLNDANKWLLSDATEVDRPNPKTGATALHVAAAKGYTNVLSLLLAGRANVDRQDNDGWTPLHAAAHWGQKETAEMLVESWANMDIRNYAGQSCIDVADRKMVKFLEELRANKRNKRRPSSQIRISDAIENHVDKTPTKLVRVEVRTDAAKDAENVKPNQQIHAAEHSVEDEAPWRRKTLRTPNDSPTKNQVPDKELSGKSGNESANDVILRRTHSFENDQKFYQKYNELRARIKANSCPILLATTANALPGNANNNNNQSSNNNNNNNNNNINNNKSLLLLGQTANTTGISSSNNYNNTSTSSTTNTTTTFNTHTNNTTTAAAATTTATAATTTSITSTANPSLTYSVQRSASLKDNSVYFRKPIAPVAMLNAATTTTPTTTVLSSPSTTVHTPPIRSNPAAQSSSNSNNNGSTTASAVASEVETPKPKQSAGNIFKNFFKSFVPPVRDEESETQRKAHAKRVRETRRSTQGVTLDEIKSAEELVKKKNLGMNKNNNNNNNNTTTTATATTTTTNNSSSSSNNSNSNSNSNSDNNSPQEPQPPPPPTTPPPSIIPSTTTTADDSEIIEAVVATLAPSDVIADTTASFTLAAPTARRSDDLDVDAGSDAEDDQQTAVSASFTMFSRREKPVEEQEKSLKTDAVAQELNPLNSESAGLPARPTDLAIATTATAESKPVTLTPATTPGVLESPVRLRDKRSLSTTGSAGGAGGAGQELDAKSDTASPVSTHADFNARDSLLSLYARRTVESGAGSGGASGAVANSAVAPSTSSSSTATATAAERRPSWRLKFDAGSKFKLEDITSGGTYPPNQSTIIPSAPAVMAAVNLANTAGAQRRISSGPNALNASNQSLNSVGRPVSAPSETINNSAYMTPPARRYETTSAATTTATTTANNSASAAASANHATASSATTSHVDKDNDKENDNRTQTVIQRRRKPKRRSTGVVHLDMDELDPERQHESANNDNDEKEKESGSERTSRSRTASTATTSAASDSKSTSSSDKAENGDGIDYKALWEAAKMENDKLKQMLKQKDDEVVQTRATLERFANATTKNSLSEIEKRERRAMERKLSELEEELKQLDVYKSDNHRLKEENAALIRVISKLSK